MTNFFDCTPTILQSLLQAFGKETFRAQQLFKWVYQKRIHDFEQMTNLSKDFRRELVDLIGFDIPAIVREQSSSDGTRKFLIQIKGGEAVESVLIPSDDRKTLCISSEVGCNLGCAFCFTGTTKLKQRLTVGQIVGQYLAVLDQKPGPVSNVVFMGMGEPLDNADNVVKAIDILCDQSGIGLSRKRITISTAGIVPKIAEVTKARVRLAVSLNGANDEVRSKLMPVNRRWPIAELMGACKKHAEESGDRVTFAYVLIKGLTDSLKDAEALRRITKDVPCKINIIPFNPFPGSEFLRPSDQEVFAFHNRLQQLGTHVLYRRSKGTDILAACGQLNPDLNSDRIGPNNI